MEKAMMEKASRPLAEKKHEGKKKIHMTVHPTDNDGFHVEHNEDGAETKHYVFDKIDGVHGHMDKHYGKPKADKKHKESAKMEAAEMAAVAPAPEPMAPASPMGMAQAGS